MSSTMAELKEITYPNLSKIIFLLAKGGGGKIMELLTEGSSIFTSCRRTLFQYPLESKNNRSFINI